jgi:YidC/Oxa1 family membrane protein insertase
MEQKNLTQFDNWFCIDFGILLWIMYQNQPDPAVIAAEKAQKELVIQEAKAKVKR